MQKFTTKNPQSHHSLKLSFLSSKLKRVYFIFSLLLFSFFIMGNSGGPAAAGNGGRTGAPGDAGNCSNCHSGGSFGTVSTTTSVFKSGTTTSVTSYNADSTYDIKVTVNHTSGNPGGHGFQMTALKTTNTAAGSFKNPGANVQISSTSGRQYPEHTSINTSNIFTIQWKAPAVGTGKVTFYSYGNCVDGTGGTGGDKAGGGTLALTEAIVAPVKISSFTVQANNNNNLLNWVSSNEQNNCCYNVQYSSNGKDFTTIATVNSKATNGNSSSNISYSFTHENIILQHSYYRLQQIDKDGKLSYVSEIKESLLKNKENIVSIFPNPVLDVINLTTNNEKEVIVKVFDMNGFLVKQAVKSSGSNSIKINALDMSKGFYTISLFQDGRFLTSQKVIKL